MTSGPEDSPPPSTDPIRLEQQLLGSLTRLWHRGWMPADVVAAVAFEMPARIVELVTELIFAEHLQQDYGSHVSPRWQHQINSLGPTPTAAKPLSLMALSDAADLHIALSSLPNLRSLGPLPGTGSISAERVRKSPATPGGTSDPDLLRRVRALLAKAEATDFEAEADAFTTKAQTIIATHSLHHLLHSLDDPPDASAGPDAMRLAIERPYDREKFGLLSAVATANRCRAVLHSQLGLATVMGFTVDLEAVELLYTSLLVQATRSMRAHGSRSDHFGTSTTRSFRRSFLTGFAIRVGQRLDAATAEATHDSERQPGGSRLLPALASRADEVDRAIDLAFPEAQRLRSRARIDASGYTAGVDAADRADLGARRAIAS